jgi:hypothetical protein
MSDDPAYEITKQLLAAISLKRGSGMMASFFYGKPDAPRWDRRLGTELFYNAKAMNHAALLLRQKGPAHLRFLSIGELWSKLQHVVTESFWYLQSGLYQGREVNNFLEFVAASAIEQFARSTAMNDLLDPVSELTIFPIGPVRVQCDFDSSGFFLIRSTSLIAKKLPISVRPAEIAANKFPPISEFKGRYTHVDSWLGVRGPTFQNCSKHKAAILGALALTSLPDYRYAFNGVTLSGGRCTFNKSMTFSPTEPHTPQLMYPIEITEADHRWMGVLTTKLCDSNKKSRREIRGLQYYYRAWPLETHERFPVLCMALDAVFGEEVNGTQAIIDGVRHILGAEISEDRLRLLMKLRASVVHGGAPDVFESSKYGKYYSVYHVDPIRDLELIVAASLRLRIFGDSMRIHPDRHAGIIAEAQAQGRLPKDLTDGAILPFR